MEDTFISYEDTQDPAGCNWGPDRYQEFSRDPERTPMQWSSAPGAGEPFFFSVQCDDFCRNYVHLTSFFFIFMY